MKRILCAILVCAMLCGCTDNSSVSSDIAETTSITPTEESSQIESIEKIDISAVEVEKSSYCVYNNPITYYTHDEICEIITQNTDFVIAEQFSHRVPSSVDHVSVMHKFYPEADSLPDYYRSFLETFAYLYPEKELDDAYLYYYGKNSNLYGDNTYSDVKTIGTNWEDYLREQTEDVYYMFYSPFFNKDKLPASDVENRFLELSSPVGTVMTNFNKGKLSAFISAHNNEPDNRFLETYTSPNAFAFFATFDPITGTSVEWPVISYAVDSKETITMLDGKEIAICDAVQFYEDYMNALPISAAPTTDLQVMGVEAVEIADTGKCCLQFSTAFVFEGIPFDYSLYGVDESRSGSDSYEYCISTGYMAVTDDVDAAYGFGRGMQFSERTDIKQIVSFQDAVICCKENMTQFVNWEILFAELVYCAGNKQTAEPPLQYEQYDVAPYYKMILHNPSDALDYVVYVEALSGEFSRYSTAQGYKID